MRDEAVSNLYGRNENRGSQGGDNSLGPRLLGFRADIEAAFEKLLVAARYVDRGERCGNRQREEKCPSLPVVERPCRNEYDGEDSKPRSVARMAREKTASIAPR